MLGKTSAALADELLWNEACTAAWACGAYVRPSPTDSLKTIDLVYDASVESQVLQAISEINSRHTASLAASAPVANPASAPASGI